VTTPTKPSFQPTVVHYSTVAGALVGVALWALQTYAFPSGVPGALQVAIPIVLPAAIAGVSSFVTRFVTKGKDNAGSGTTAVRNSTIA
jgi:uncharacterized membrane protein